MEWKESGTVELKETLTPNLNKEIIAFANSHGGSILIGIDDNGTVVGVDSPEEKAESIQNSLRDAIAPDISLHLAVSIKEVEQKSVIQITVLEGAKKPYHLIAKGLKPTGVYVRQGTSSAPASNEAIRQMIRDTDGVAFETMRCLNQELTFDYAEKEFANLGLGFEENHKITLGIQDTDGFYTNTGLLLSDQCGHIVKCGVYQGTTAEIFQKRKEFHGSVLKQLDDAYQMLHLLNPLVSEFVALKRKDKEGYPPIALREILVNAIVHRDYDYSGPILIHAFTDRIEVASLGGLVKGLPESAIGSGISQPRNPKLANIFYRLQLIESYGTGIRRIKNAYENSGMTAEFLVTEGSFVSKIPNLAYQKKA